jgi:hypothetical protein
VTARPAKMRVGRGPVAQPDAPARAEAMDPEALAVPLPAEPAARGLAATTPRSVVVGAVASAGVVAQGPVAR